MAEYKDTLNLPNTAFAMKANLAQREPLILQEWEDQSLYHAIQEARKDSPTFLLHDGPPYANGHLHCGHALNKILKDMVVKSKTLSGYRAPFVPGWDCHGLPIELNVEKKFGKASDRVHAAAFREKCREYAATQIDIQRAEFKRLGTFGAWDKPYVTMDYHYEANTVRALGRIIANGHLEQGFKPVHWCVDCGSALAEAEVEYEDKTSPSIDVAFYAVKSDNVLRAFNTKATDKPALFPIWTTTPWTLPANEAVCVHPSLVYSLVDVGHAYWVIASDLVESVMARTGRVDYEILAEVAGKSLEHIALKHPFIDKTVPVICGEHVTTEAGTGCVHTAPAHGPDDYIVGLAYHLPLQNPVLGNGTYSEEVEQFVGLSVFKANTPILELLHEKGVLLHQEKLTHSYPHCWRHKSPVIFRATPQWFISMDKNGLRQQMLKAVEAVEFVPDWGRARIKLMIESRPDWCISRQRAWGTPIPLFVHKSTRALHPNTLDFIETIAKEIEKKGIEAWFSLDKDAFLGAEGEQYDKITDTLDVWFDSGVTHFCVLGRDGLPEIADVYLEGSDQHRGWFNSSLTTAVAIHGRAPYKKVLTHGYTVDAHGKKLSKSAGNYVELDKLIKQHGADVLRLWVASTDYRNEVSISEEIIKRTSEAYRRIRNTARFLLANLFDFDPLKDAVDASELTLLDKWMITRTERLQAEIIEAYEQFQFHLLYQKIHNFCTVDLGSFYLDIIKDRQYTTPKNSLARRSCQTAMEHVLQALTRWLMPILSFTAEEIWQHLPRRTEAHLFSATWYNAWPKMDAVDESLFTLLQKLKAAVNKALEIKRQEGVIGTGLEASVKLYLNDEDRHALHPIEDELKFFLITSKVSVHPASEKDAQALLMDELNAHVAIIPLDAPKCERCWHRVAEIGQNNTHPTLCPRCIGNITGHDEIRRFA